MPEKQAKPEIQVEPVMQVKTESEIFKLLENRAVMVTVNRRLARYLTRRFHRRQMDGGLSVWETPDILPYNVWLARLYDQAHSAAHEEAFPLKTLLSPSQEPYLWEQIISGSEASAGLLRIPETAGAAAQAWDICRQWRLEDKVLSQVPTEETRTYLRWAQAFGQKCRANLWQDRAGLADRVLDFIAAGHLSVPENLIFAGFDEFSPQQAALIQAIQDLGGSVSTLAAVDVSSSARRCTLPDTRAEITAAAGWARDLMEKNPSIRIGIVVPDINALRPTLVRIFDEVLHPSRILCPEPSRRRAWNISMGRPLPDYPVIHGAFMVLAAASRPFAVEDYSRFLMSPFIGGADAELSQRALLDACLRAEGEVELPISAFIEYSKSFASGQGHGGISCPILNRRLVELNRVMDQLPRSQPPSAWVRDFSALLDAAGWPGERTLSSEEHQTVIAWHEALTRFASMDTVCHTLDLESALACLGRIAGETIFQPETEDVPVQILGMLEAAGEGFDHLWIMGMDAETWPPPSRPNPFLPVRQQKQYHVPHGSPEREFDYARHITGRMLSAAGQVMVSVPARDGDAALFPSPLIAHLEETEFALAEKGRRPEISEIAVLETITDQHGPAPDAHTHISGGTGLLKAQAACPFSAFAGYRLHARPLETPVPGLNPRERGSLVHLALEFFWAKIKTSDALAGLSQDGLIAEIENATGRAVAAMAKKHPRTFTQRFRELEKQRLADLLQAFLIIEARRPPFTVADREEKLECTVAGIRLKTFADRIDRIADGRLVIVDYKTGESSDADWFTDRIAEPQLPLYSFAVGRDVAAVVFAQIKKGNVRYLGVADDADLVPGAKGPGHKKSAMENFLSLRDVIDYWKAKIEVLAEEIGRGYAPVMPVSTAKSCLYCDLKPLCRIGECEFLMSINRL